MKKQTLAWMLVILSLMTALSGCILVPGGDGGYHHGGDEHHDGHDGHDHD